METETETIEKKKRKTTKKKPTEQQESTIKNEIILINPFANTNDNGKKKEVKEECLICAEKFNKTSRAKVCCIYCDFTSCRECCQKYILEQPFPKCMNTDCGKEWTRAFLRKVFTSKFINTTYKESRERILYEHELSLLPATQYLVEREVRKEQIIKDIEKLHEKQNEIRRQINSLHYRYHRIATGVREEGDPLDTDADEDENSGKTLYIRKCSDPECRGFLSTQWKCGVCTKWTCNKCHENLGTDKNVEHICDPHNVATAELIAKDTKPCPKCRTNIFKIDGCDQMWCTQCNTAFSWRSGKIILDEVHNPHYFEWLRKTGGNMQQLQTNGCGQYANTTRFYDGVRDERTVISSANRNKLFDINRNLIHLRRVEIPRFNYDKTLPNQNLRVEYMRKFITENKFKTLIQQNDKKHQKHRDISNILNMVHDTVNDILLRLNNETVIQDNTMDAYFGEIEQIVDYANDCLKEVSNTYGSVCYYFNSRNLRMVLRPTTL